MVHIAHEYADLSYYQYLVYASITEVRAEVMFHM